MNSIKSSNSDPIASPRIPKFIPAITILAILISLAFNFGFTFGNWMGTSLHQQLSTGLEEMAIAPAFYVLAIWGGIYLGLFMLMAYQFGFGHEFPRSHQYWHEPEFQRTNRFLIGAVLCQALWAGLFAAHQAVLASLAMAGVVTFLVRIYRILGISVTRASRRRRWLCHAPISLYLGWATFLTVITVATGLYHAGWQVGAADWGVIVIIALALFSAWFIATYRDTLFTIGVIWGLVMVALQRQGVTEINLVSAFAAAMLLFWLVWVKNPPRQKYLY